MKHLPTCPCFLTSPKQIAAALALTVAVLQVLPASAQTTTASIQADIDRVASRYPGAIRVSTIGSSAAGSAIRMMTLSEDQQRADSRPAVLVVAGMDGHHRTSAAAAVAAAESLVADPHDRTIADYTIYIVPIGNPDAFDRGASLPPELAARNARAIDNDSDGAFDEDPPRDLDGDGAITTIRRSNPPAGEGAASWMSDPRDQRLLKLADHDKGEVAVWSIAVEAADSDGDGLLGEDPQGGVDPDRNFPAKWREFEVDSGPYALSEPESRTLASFVADHGNICSILVLGRNDTLVKLPDSSTRDADGPLALDSGDASLYGEVAKFWKETSKQSRAADSDLHGSFILWAYQHRGIPAFGCQLWGRPDPKPPEPAAVDAGATDHAPDAPPQTLASTVAPPAVDPAAEPTAPEARGQGRPPGGGGRAGGGRGRRSGRPGESVPPPASDASKAFDEEAAAWLTWFDSEGVSSRFAPWKSFSHPTQGEVEIGGFRGGARTEIPASDVAAASAHAAALISDLARRSPLVRCDVPVVTTLAPGLYRIDLAIINDGAFPTATKMGVTNRVPRPINLRISVPVDRIVAGRPTIIINRLAGSSGREDASWIVRAAPEELITVSMDFPLSQPQSLTIQGGKVRSFPAAALTTIPEAR